MEKYVYRPAQSKTQSLTRPSYLGTNRNPFIVRLVNEVTEKSRLPNVCWNLKENLVLLWKNLNEFWIVFFHSDIYLQIRISFKYRTKKMMHGYFLSFFIDSTWPIDILGLWKMYFSDHMLVSDLGSFFIVTHWGKIFEFWRLRFQRKNSNYLQGFIRSRVFGQKIGLY